MKKNESALMACRYEIILTGSDEDAIMMLDFWLERWLYYRDRCPNCGTDAERDA